MRRGLKAGILALACLGATVPYASAEPYPATVTVDKAELRSGPSDDAKFYVTNRLRRGDRVEVVNDRNDGWLEVRPPTRSFSWINKRYIEPVHARYPNWVVTQETGRVEVYIGSEVIAGRPTVVGPKLAKGAQVVAIGALINDADGAWLPIKPPDGEIRYVRKEAVVATAAVAPAPSPVPQTLPARPITPVVLTPPPPAPKPLAIPGGVPVYVPAAQPAAAPTLDDVNGLLARAQQAEKVGDIRSAIDLYTQASSLGRPLNHPRATEALDRAYFLSHPTMQVKGEVAAQPTADSRVRAMPPEEALPPPQVHLSPPAQPEAVARQPAVGTVAAAPPVATAPEDLGYAGTLRRVRSGILEGKVYALEPLKPNGPRFYLTAGPGIDLDSYLKQTVFLNGTIKYENQLRAFRMTVTQIRALQ